MKSSVFLLLCCIIFCFACNKPNSQTPPVNTIQSDKSSITLAGNVNSSDSFNIQSTGEWTISLTPSSISWLTISALSGTGNKKIIVTINEANNTGANRTASLSVNTASGDQPVQINITQRISTVLSVNALTPDHGPANTLVTISGSGFDPSTSLDTVFFNGKKATVVSASSTAITAKVPVGSGTGNVRVKVGNTVMAGQLFTYELSPVATIIAGSGGAGYSNGVGTSAYFATPTGITIDTFGNIYVTDLGAYDVRKITSSYTVTTFAGSPTHQGNVNGTGTSALFAYINDVATDLYGNVYVVDFNNENIRKITPAGVVTTFLTNVMEPTGIAVDPLGNIYVASPFVTEIRKYTPSGQMTSLGSNFGGLFDVTVDGSGNLYTVDHERNRINKITPSGVVTTIAGTGNQGFNNGPGATATFNDPKSIAIDKSGNIYIADVGNNAIRKIDYAGNVSTYLDHVSSYTTDASFFGPYGVAVDKDGVVYVSNTSENRILKITLQ